MSFLAPAHSKRKGLTARIFQGIGLSVLAVFLLIAASAIQMAQFYYAPTPNQLYQATLEAVQHMHYKKLDPEVWDELRTKYEDKIVDRESAIKYANEMIKSLDDPHTRLHNPLEVNAINQQAAGNFAGVGIQFKFQIGPNDQPILTDENVPLPAVDSDGYPMVDKVLDGGPSKKVGIKDGESLVSADGTSLKGMAMDKLVETLRGKVGSTVKVTVKDVNGVEREVTITRGLVELPTVTVESYGDIGYIGLSAFMQNDTLEEMQDAFKAHEDKKALIFDLRGNSGGRLDFAYRIASMLMEKGHIVKVESRVPAGDYSNEITTVTNDGITISNVEELSGGTMAFKRVGTMSRFENFSGDRPLIVLVDGGSASASEVLSGALKGNDRAVIVGTKTFGKGVGQGMIPFAGQTLLRVTTFRFLSPIIDDDGNWHWVGDAHNNRIGIVPDHVIERSDNFRPLSDKDNQLQFAIELLNKELSGN